MTAHAMQRPTKIEPMPSPAPPPASARRRRATFGSEAAGSSPAISTMRTSSPTLRPSEGRAELVEGVTRLSGGRIDAIVANAGGGPPETMLALNFFGAVATLEGLRPLLAASPAPRAVMVSSIASLAPTDPALVEACLSVDERAATAAARAALAAGKAPLDLYGSAKHALNRWCRRVASEPQWAGAGIPLNVIAPGVIDTPAAAPILSDPDRRAQHGTHGPDARRLSRSPRADGRHRRLVRQRGKRTDDRTNPVCRRRLRVSGARRAFMVSAAGSQLTKTVAYARAHGVRPAVELAANFVLPFLIYNFSAQVSAPSLALMTASMPPILWAIAAFIRERKIDAISILVLSGIALSLLAFAGGGGVKFLQLRENLVTGLVGLVFLGSAAIGRPLIYQLARSGVRRRAADKVQAFEALRDDTQFRRDMTVATLVWGFGLVGLVRAQLRAGVHAHDQALPLDRRAASAMR